MNAITQLSQVIVGLFLICPVCLDATTIIPFKNLGELAIRSDAVVRARAMLSYEHLENGTTFFRTKLVVLDQIKGDLLAGDDFEVQKWERVINDKWMSMWGDIDLYDGSTYLLFLEKRESGLYHPICFSYYSFEEITMKSQSYLVPSEHAKEFELVMDDEVEPLAVYRKEGLIQELKAVVQNQKAWSSKTFATEMHHHDFFGQNHKRSEPNHCNYLTSNGKYFRWKDFATSSVAVHYSVSGQSGCSTANAKAQQAINEINSAYPSVNLVDGGTVNYSPTCQYGSALGSSYRNWIATNLNGQRHVVIQYDDPCNEIADLSGCSGTLAIGGLYGIGSHNYNGESWYTGGYGYVIVNNGVGACRCSQMVEILTHEVTHSLGLGHILSSSGDANMNPSCCEEITQLDESCVAFSYDEVQGALPLELVSFTGDAHLFVNELSWTTAWEANVDRFVVQRANDVKPKFEDIAVVDSKGDTEFGHNYQFTDHDPDPESYYRLMSIDYDGSSDYSEIISIRRQEVNTASVYPTLTRDYINVRMPANGLNQLEIISSSGAIQQTLEVNDQYSKLWVQDFPQGWYYVTLSTEVETEAFKFYKTD